MSLVAAYNRCACLLLVLGITAFTTAAYNSNETAPLLAVIGLPAAVIAWWLSVRGRFLLPRWMVNGLLTLALLYAILRVSQGLNVEVIAELVVFIQVIKIGDRRSPRDDAQILSLAVFLAIAAMLTSNDFWVGLQIIAFVPLLIVTVMLFQVYAGWSAAVAAGAPAPPPTLTRQFRGAVVFSTLGAAAMAIFIFIIVPRGIGENALGNWRQLARHSTTGFTDHVKLGSRSVISTSPKIVMEVLIRESTGADEPTGLNLGNAETIYYLRGAVMDTYRNGAWVPDVTSRLEPIQVIDSRSPLDRDYPLGAGSRSSIEQEISMRSIGENLAPLFAVWRPVRIQVGRGTRSIHLDREARTLRRNGTGGAFNYRIWSAIAESASAAEKRTPTSFDSPPILDLAAGVLRAGGIDPDPATRPVTDDARAARLIESHLQHNYAYSLVEQPTPEGQDPIEHFLFTTKEGHCEYFAAAMTAMCRSVGINARMVAGYIAAEFNPATGNYVIRESNAHAWTEAEAGEGRWLRYDPTPPGDLTRLHRPAPGLFGRLRRAMESAEYAWNASVVSFDEGTRQRLLGPDDDSRPGVLSRLDRIAERIRAAGPRHFLSSLVTGLAVFLAVAAAGFLFQGLALLIANLRWWPRRAKGPKALPAGFDPAHARFYLRLLELLARRGHQKPPWRPPLEHASAIAAADAPLADATAHLSDLYYQLRFAGRSLSQDEQDDAAATLERIAAPLRRR